MQKRWKQVLTVLLSLAVGVAAGVALAALYDAAAPGGAGTAP